MAITIAGCHLNIMMLSQIISFHHGMQVATDCPSSAKEDSCFSNEVYFWKVQASAVMINL